MIGKLTKIRRFKIADKIAAILHGLVVTGLALSYTAYYVSPADAWIIAFAGLGYPIILSIHFLFILYWAVRRQGFLIILSFVVIFAGARQFNAFYVIYAANDKLDESGQDIRVMSYNVRLFDLYNWTKNKETRNLILSFLNKNQADIVCFQEFYYRNDGKFTTRDTLMQLMSFTDYQEGFTHEIHGKQFFGLATFSKYPMLKKAEIKFPNDANNLAIYCDVKVNHDTIRIYNVHLKSIRFKKEDYEAISANGEMSAPSEDGRQRIITKLKTAFIDRALQSEIIANHIHKCPYPVIVCGDFNDTPTSYAYAQFFSHLKDAHRESGSGMGKTYVGIFPSFRIDYIFHSPELHSYGFVTHKEELSDHRAISTTIQLPYHSR